VNDIATFGAFRTHDSMRLIEGAPTANGDAHRSGSTKRHVPIRARLTQLYRLCALTRASRQPITSSSLGRQRAGTTYNAGFIATKLTSLQARQRSAAALVDASVAGPAAVHTSIAAEVAHH
jgi:hypothetical protein